MTRDLDLGEIILDLLGNVPLSSEATASSSSQSTRSRTPTRRQTASGETRPTLGESAETADSGATRR